MPDLVVLCGMDDIVKQAIRYDAATGKLFWLERPEHMFSSGKIPKSVAMKIWNTRYAGKEITSLDGPGYIAVHLKVGKRIRICGHRVAWFLHYGRWPSKYIDHINGIKTDNRISNLRDASGSENNRNRPISSRNTSGKVGVTFYKRTSQWRAWFKVDGRCISLGYHDQKEAAIAARIAAEKIHGFCERQVDSEAELGLRS